MEGQGTAPFGEQAKEAKGRAVLGIGAAQMGRQASSTGCNRDSTATLGPTETNSEVYMRASGSFHRGVET